MALLVVLCVQDPALLDLLVLLPDEVAETKDFLLLLALFVQVYFVQLVHVLVHDFEHLLLVQRVLREAWLLHDFTHFVVEGKLLDVDVRGGCEPILDLAHIQLLSVLLL